MNLLEWMNKKAELERSPITKAKVKDIMTNGTIQEKEDLWKKVEELGGYEGLEDGEFV